MAASSAVSCVFCAIAKTQAGAEIVHADDTTMAFLDHRPLFPGHCLVVPKWHCETLGDLPADLVEPLFTAVHLLARAVVAATGAEGSFVGINNRVSQSVPHLHVHVVPRRRGDGLRGFFWPRRRYADIEEIRTVAEAIRSAAASLQD